jgi:Ca2+-binding RTX toxin-like protein
LVNQQFQAIWDVGGIDALIVDPGNISGAVIDLRAATLQYEWGGGGFVSYIRGVGGGYTIAGGVVIENATGGAGPDDLIGSSANNVLNGGGGDDIIDGGVDGADTLIGGAGSDTLSYILAGAGVAVNLGANNVGGAAAGDTISGFENLLGSVFNDTLTGDAGDNVIEGGAGADVLAGGAGDDTASYAGSSAAVNVTLGGATSGGDATGDTLSGFENLIGSDFSDHLNGNAGDNRLDGGIGVDTLAGGAGNDTYVLDNKDDVVTELAGEGTDRVQVMSSYQLPSNMEILEAIGTASSRLVGNATNDTILGNAGDNTLVGGAGADQLNGGLGFDRAEYIGSSAGVSINLATQTASGGDALGDILTSIEDLTGSNFNDVLAGSAEANFLFGQGGADHLIGLDGDDLLDGGAGADLMSGGAGNDSYVVDDAGDAIAEAIAGGIDFVEASISFTLGSGLEDLTLTGAAALSGTGNSLDNFITGNSATNTLTGNGGNDALDGGAGADAMDGGNGDDTYFVDEVGDSVIENSAAGGVDTVVSNINFTLGANFENLFLNGVPDGLGTSISGGGNELDNLIVGDGWSNVISGFDGNDVLDGGGGGDRLIGGAGDDLYLVRVGVIVDEVAGGGSDTVEASVSMHLADFVERLDLIGEDYIFGIGNSGDNTINGNIGDNFLSGMFGNDSLNGGAGNDTLDGGADLDTLSGGLGDDSYILDFAGDVVTEFANQGADTVTVSFSGYTLGANLESLVLLGTFGGAFGVGNGNALNNTITGNFAGNILNGGDGDDVLIGGANFDFLNGEVGNATLDGGADPDTLDGGAGVDTVSYMSSGAGVTVNLATGVHFGGDAEGDVLAGIENAMGSGKADSLTGDAGVNRLSGGSGNDTLTGLAGDDILIGGAGADSVAGGGGVDTADYAGSSAAVSINLNAITGTGLGGDAQGDTLVSIENLIGSPFNDTLIGRDFVANTLTGGDGNDVLSGGTGGADVMSGGNGIDTLDYSLSPNGVDVRLFSGAAAGGSANGDTYSGIENIIGAATKTDTIAGDAGANQIWGGGGNETITGREGSDTLHGEAGNDTLLGGADSDVLIGGIGADTLGGGSQDDLVDYSASDAGVTVNLQTGSGTGGHAQGDVLVSIEDVIGSAFDDVIVGKNNVWDNVFDGRGGNDTYTGGLGNDVFVFRASSGADTVTDFSAAAASNNDAVQLVGFGAAFDSFAEVIAAASQVGADTVIDFGGGQTLTLQNTTLASLAAGDFIFGP